MSVSQESTWPRWRQTARLLRRLPRILVSGDRAHSVIWIRSHRPGWLVENRRPWITFAAAEFLDKWTAEARSPLTVFEYGSGASTLYWLDRGARVVSIEHDAGWYAHVRNLLPVSSDVDYRLIPAQPDESTKFDPSDPALCQSDDPTFRHQNFTDYVHQIDDFPDQHFDIVLVDGRARAACLAHAVPKARGLLVLDNADRPYYLARMPALLSGFEQRMFTGLCPSVLDPTRTDVFVRHSDDAS